MDPLAARAAEDYHRLLRDDKALVQELESRFFARMREARLTFGGRVLCAFSPPNFVAPADYEAIRVVCRDIFRAVEKVERRLGEELWDRVDVDSRGAGARPDRPGYRRSSPTSRLDSFIKTDAYRFVELNAESPAGIAYNEVLVDIFLELPVMKRFQERWKLHPLPGPRAPAGDPPRVPSGGRAAREERPTIAIVDYEEVPTRSEQHLFREFFEKERLSGAGLRPAPPRVRGGAAAARGHGHRHVYKRLLTNEFLEKGRRAAGALAGHPPAGGHGRESLPLQAHPQEGDLRVLTDDEVQPLFTEKERQSIASHVPWTRRVRERADDPAGPRGRPHRVRARASGPARAQANDEYGGKGVYIGWEASETEWEEALAHRAALVVRGAGEGEPAARDLPELSPQLGFRDLIVDLDPSCSRARWKAS